jgi:two-component system, OmpR family, alkaline phosphatase synthesis response regulator PhoP
VLRATVERLGHTSTAVTDGAAALAAYESERPQVVITDLQMSGIDGVELGRRIRALDGSSPYIAVLSASGDRAAGALGDAADAVLSKPAREDELQAVLGLAAQRAL